MESNNSTIIDLSGVSSISELVSEISLALDSEEYTNRSLFLKIGNIDLKQSQLLSIKALIEALNSTLEGVKTESKITETSAINLGISTKEPENKNVTTFQDAFKNNSADSTPKQEEAEFSTFAQLKKANSIGDFVTDTTAIPEVEEIEEDETLEAETNEFLEEIEADSDEADSEENIDDEEETDSEEEENIYEKLSSEQEISAPKNVEEALDVTFGESFYANSSLYTEDSAVESLDKNYETTEVIKNENEAKYILLDTEGITPEGIELIKANTSDLDTLYLTQTLRSGQTVSFEGNIFIIGDVHPGSEVNATGDITVWGILGGIVHAGSNGNTDAKVRALKLNPIQLRIANLYSRRNDTINVPYVQRTNEFTPEEARIDKNQIVIYKTLRRED